MAGRNSSRSDSLAPASTLGRVAERYEVVREIARGGMGVVYLVRDDVSGEERALKRVLLRDSRHLHVYRAAFEREYQVLASLDHPHIVRVHEYGVDQDGPYYTMEFVRGRDLTKGVPRPWREACSLMRDVASSLSLLHARRLLYRDLNPGNVKLTSEEHCTLLDFGALTDFGRQKWLIGAAPCVPPEALQGEALDQRSDLFALGALSYWTLTGRHAYPAIDVVDLPETWERLPRPPSAWIVDVPEALDELVMSLLSTEPLARPSSAAEVIAKLTVIAKLPPEDADERRRVARSFLTVPPFVGRTRELAWLDQHVRASIAGHGVAMRITAPAGAGRTRLLDEVAVRAQLAGATALRVDASVHPGAHGTSRALALRLLDLLPDLATACAAGHRAALCALGGSVEMRLPAVRSAEAASADPSTLWAWFVEVSRQRPLVIGVDNVELCDDASVGLLSALMAHVGDAAIAFIVVERDDHAMPRADAVLRAASEPLRIGNLTRDEMRVLARSLFGETPHVERFADWLHDRSAGSPLHALDLVRHLVEREVIRRESGYWVLPVRRGEADVGLPEALEAALSQRLSGLGPRALALAQTLALLRIDPSLALCRKLLQQAEPREGGEGGDEQATLALLDELAQQSVLLREGDAYRFESSAMRDAVLASTADFVRLAHHLRLGEALAEMADASDMVTRLEAGWQLMQGGQELRGAGLVASVMAGSFRLVELGLASYPLGPVSELALQVYAHHRQSYYARMPLLGATAQAILHDNYALYERHADSILDVLDVITGMGLARRLRAWVGGWLALMIALWVAFARFHLVPKRERSYTFKELLGQLGNCVCMFSGAAALGLDAERAEQIASTLAPLDVLPDVATLRGVHLLCEGQTLVSRERPAEAFDRFDLMARRFQDARWYRLLPKSDRAMCVATAMYGRAAMSVYRADGGTLLADATALEHSGLHAYAMVVPHLRFLYHAQRGEQALAATYQAQIEQQAVDGSVAWHAELWVSAALVPVSLSVGDLMGVTHIVHRMEELTRIAPSMQFYHRLSKLALLLARDDIREENILIALRELDTRAPRSFIGWTTLLAQTARTRNRQGRHAEARALCERALVTMSDDDREYVGLFLQVELETAIADAGLGEVRPAMARLDGLLRRFGPSRHPLALGLLHEARAQVAQRAGLAKEYQESLTETERIFRPTGTPELIAKVERLAALQRTVDKSLARPSQQLLDEGVSTIATELVGPTRAEPHRER